MIWLFGSLWQLNQNQMFQPVPRINIKTIYNDALAMISIISMLIYLNSMAVSDKEKRDIIDWSLQIICFFELDNQHMKIQIKLMILLPDTIPNSYLYNVRPGSWYGRARFTDVPTAPSDHLYWNDNSPVANTLFFRQSKFKTTGYSQNLSRSVKKVASSFKQVSNKLDHPVDVHSW